MARLQDLVGQALSETPTTDFLEPAPVEATADDDFSLLSERIRGRQEEERPGVLSAFPRGVSRGISNVGTDFLALSAAASKSVGNLELSEKRINRAIERTEELNARLGPAPDIGNLLDSPRDFVETGLGLLGEQLPILGSVALGAGAGAITGRLVGRGIAKQALAGATDEAARAVVRKAGATGLRRGVTTGVVGTASGIEGGAIALEQQESVGELTLGPIALGGLAAGSLEAILPLGFAKLVGLTPRLAGGLAERIGAALAAKGLGARIGLAAIGASGVEATTEALQEAIAVGARAFVDENFELLSKETATRIGKAAATGGFIGFFLGGAGGAISPRPTTVAPADADQQETVTTVDDPAIVVESVAKALAPTGVTPAAIADEIGIISVPLTDEEGSPIVTQFASGEEALQITAARPRTETDLKFFRLKDNVDTTSLDISVTVRQLPKATEIVEGNPRVTGSADAILLGRRAAQLRDAEFRARARKGSKSVNARKEIAGLREESEEQFIAALAAGFRAAPRTGDSFLVIGNLDPNLLEQIESQPIPQFVAAQGRIFNTHTPIFDTTIGVRDFGNGEKGFLFRPQGFADSAIVNPQQTRFFTFNRELADPKDLTGELTPELGVQVAQIAGQNVAIQRQSLENLGFQFVESETVDEAIATLIESAVEGAVGFGAINESIAFGTRVPITERSFTFVGDQLPADLVSEIPAAPIRSEKRGIVANPLPQAEVLTKMGDFTIVGAGSEDLASQMTSGELLDGEVSNLNTPAYQKLSRANKRKFDQMVRRYRAATKQFMPETHLIVVVTDDQTSFGRGEIMKPTFAHQFNVEGEIAVIVFNADTLASVSFPTFAAHEYGHALATRLLANEDSAVIQQLLTAYNRTLVAADQGTITDFTRRTVSPRTGFEKSFVSDASGLSRQDADYWYNFDEFFAEQIARWVISSETPVGSLQKFMKVAAKKIFEALRITKGVDLKDFRPEPEMQAWLDAVAVRKFEGAQSITLAGTTQSVKAGKLSNAAALGEPLNKSTPPRMAETIPLRQVLNAVLGDTTEAKEIAAQADKISWFSKWGLTIQQIAKNNPHIQTLQIYVDLIEQWNSFKMAWVSMADGRTREMRNLGKTQLDALSKLIFQVDDMTYRSKEEIEAGVIRQPTIEELQAFAEEFGVNEQAFEVYLRVQDDFARVLAEIKDTMIIDAQQNLSEPGDLAVRTAEINEQFEAMARRPYFPHSRFGNFTVTVKEAGKTVEFIAFDNARARDKAAAFIREEFKGQTDISVRTNILRKSSAPFRGLPPGFLELLRSRLDLTQEQREDLDQMVLESAPAASFRKRFINRKNIPGFSRDVLRGYADYFFHASGHLARIRFAKPMQQSIDATNTDALSFEAGTKRTEITDTMQQHLDYINNPGIEWAWLRSLAFHFYLGFNPVSAAVNFTQVPMVAWPFLAARYGDITSAKALTKAVLDYRNLITGNTEKITDQELANRSRALAQGFLNESQATELAGTAEMRGMARMMPGNAADRFLMHASHWSAWMFHNAETFNRDVTFLAATRLALENPTAPRIQALKKLPEFARLVAEGETEENALAFLAGKDAVDETQFNYARHARPRFMQGRKGSVFTFFMFTQKMLFFAAKDPGAARFWLIMLGTAGLMGLPGADDLNTVAKLIGKKVFGAQFDLELEVRKFVVELTDGTVPPDLILNGMSRAGFGIPAALDMLGIPAPSVDLSANLGLGRIIPGLSELSPTSDFERNFSQAASGAAGASFGIGFNLLKALADDHPDGFKTWERAMPKAMRNVVKAARFAMEGREKTRIGSTVVEFDVGDPRQLGEIIAQGLGFSSTRVNRAFSRDRALQESLAYWDIRKGILLAQFDHVKEMDDSRGIADVRAAMKRYNRSVPFREQRITRKTLKRSRKGREDRRRARERSTTVQRSGRGLARENRRLFPEVIDEREVR